MKRFQKSEIMRWVTEIENHMSPGAKNELIKLSPKHLYLTHFGLGQWIRNYILERERGRIEDLDELSSKIVLSLYKKLKKKR